MNYSYVFEVTSFDNEDKVDIDVDDNGVVTVAPQSRSKITLTTQQLLEFGFILIAVALVTAELNDDDLSFERNWEVFDSAGLNDKIVHDGMLDILKEFLT